ncbi:MAG: phosphate regulon sensor histidine kinase PhoR, partial [Pseudomonadota bacterium]
WAVVKRWMQGLFRLESELSNLRRISVPDGTGIWARVLARIDFLNLRIKRNKKKYRSLLKELRDTVNAMPDGVVVLNTDFEIVRFNRAAKKALGLLGKRDRGQRIENLLRHPAFHKYLVKGDFAEGLVVRAADLTERWLFLHVIPYGEGSWLLLARDISEQARLEKMRKDFVANASHELRTPLTVLHGYLGTMVEADDFPAYWQPPINEMHAQVERMRRIVGDLLVLSKLESSDEIDDPGSVDVSVLARSAIENLGSTRQHAEVDVKVESNLRLRANRGAIESVLQNLLDNAARHTPADGLIELRWFLAQDGWGELRVRDSGEGISQQDLPRVTERFYRADRGRSRSNGGTGLGLAIVKHALGQHKASLEIRSEPGQGAEFICRFPPERLLLGESAQILGDL